MVWAENFAVYIVVVKKKTALLNAVYEHFLLFLRCFLNSFIFLEKGLEIGS